MATKAKNKRKAVAGEEEEEAQQEETQQEEKKQEKKVPCPPAPSEVEHVDPEHCDHLPDRLWLGADEAYDKRLVFACAHLECKKKCDVGSSPHCVLCPLYHPKKKGASFYYCSDKHLSYPNLNDALGPDDGEAVCKAHFDAFERVVERASRKFNGRTWAEMNDDDDDDEEAEAGRKELVNWQVELYRQLRLWRWEHYGPHTLKK